MPSDTGAVALPAPSHISVVVEDIDKTMEFLSSVWGLGPWQTVEISLGKGELTVGEPFRQRVAWAKLGSTTLELIQQLEGGGPWPEFLKTKGEGLHHIGFSISNWDEMVSKLKQQGAKMVVGGIYQGKRWCYFETKPGGIVVEFGEK